MRRQNRKTLRIRVVLPRSDNERKHRTPRVTIEQVGESEYIKKLKAEIIQREKYIEDAEKNKIDITNPLIAEILYHINQKGEITKERLSCDLQFTHKVSHNISNLLLRQKLIRRKKNKRGRWLYMKLT